MSCSYPSAAQGDQGESEHQRELLRPGFAVVVLGRVGDSDRQQVGVAGDGAAADPPGQLQREPEASVREAAVQLCLFHRKLFTAV